ncbi:hypothetical protein PCANC_09933 [Puccinia coronata f. sp. avenae]|uniref:Uncharacterized protein n=1 Tax=Puccinia coronata f. sp. avenae TaxID=200324 RepID=A0A2N5V2Y0_9BASI|nr:hypothetical protein PCANC_09933 [Puccinia coronata f. sp. avenae]
MSILPDAAHDQGQMSMLDGENHPIDAVSPSKTLPTSIDGTRAEPGVKTFDFEVRAPYQAKPLYTADQHVEGVGFIESYTSCYQSRSALTRTPPSIAALLRGTPTFRPRAFQRSQSVDAIEESPDQGIKLKRWNRHRVSLSPELQAVLQNKRPWLFPPNPNSDLTELPSNLTELPSTVIRPTGPSPQCSADWSAQPRQRLRVPRRVPDSDVLIGNMMVTRNRMIITKTHCLYPEISTLVPFPSCLIGFRLVVHPLDPKSRVKHLRLHLHLRGNDKNQSATPPIIRAIYPRDTKLHETGDRTSVRKTQEDSIGVQLGVDHSGTATLDKTQSVAFDSYTVPHASTSGVYTNVLSLTMDEDSSSKPGIDRSLCFAALLKLENSEDKSFGATMTIVPKSRREPPDKRRTGQMTWDLTYDGMTELGRLELDSEKNEATENGQKW